MYVLVESAWRGGMSVSKVMPAAHSSCRIQCSSWYFEGLILGACPCQVALISVKFLNVKITIQWSFHTFQRNVRRSKGGGGVQTMAQTERVALFLRGDTYKVCSVQIWLISIHIYFVKIAIQWSFHTF